MNNGLMVTVVGWAASTPRQVVGDGTPFTSFRLACTPRYYDRQAGAFRDRRTEWFTVKAFRDAAYNVAASVHKGDPVVVHGRLSQREWTGEDGPRTTLELDAAVVGHDLTRGTARFARTVHVAAGEDEHGSTEGPGMPSSGADDVDPWAVELPEDGAGDPGGATPAPDEVVVGEGAADGTVAGDGGEDLDEPAPLVAAGSGGGRPRASSGR